MKRVLHKLPFMGLVLLTFGGCCRHNSNGADIETIRDTVKVVRYVAPSYRTGQKIWVKDNGGNEIYYNNMSLGNRPDLSPKPGDKLFVRRGINCYGSEYMMVLKNLDAQKEYAYMNER